MEVAGANRRWRGQFRCRGSRRRSAVAQLFSLGRMNILLKCIAAWKILAPSVILLMVVWLVISCIISLTYTPAAGKVVELVQKDSGDDIYFCPVTIFRDAAGTEHTIRSSGGSNPPRFPVGSTVSVLYRAQNPDAGMIEDRFMLWICPSLLIALGIFYCTIGIMVGRWLQKKRTRNAA
jgi:hypothetical protein